jgi:Plasmid pRiA4b ORF-3-like protein/Domain of unknown function (DUF6933)
MLIIRGTKKLRDRMRTAVAASETDESSTVLGDWFATAMFSKPQVALLVNSRTMLPLFMPLAPAATLLDRAPTAIASLLREHGVSGEVVAAELAAMSELRIAPTNDRQLVGVMNEFAFQGGGFMAAREPDLARMSMQLSNLILGPLMKRHGTPRDELVALLADDATVIQFPISGDPDALTPESSGGHVHQLKVTLRDIRPPIWRRVLVEGGQTLQHLHNVIQAAFGWYDSHLHDFEIGNARYGIPDEDDWTPVRDERRVSVDQVLGDGRIRYTYDFGDNWEHDVVVEKSMPAGDIATVPDCIGGRRACPPEDCGGPWGYGELLAILADRSHPEHRERLDWLGHPYDPDAFDPSDFEENLRLQRATRFDDWPE